MPEDAVGSRLDQVVAGLFPEYSRSRLSEWIRAGALTVDDRPSKPSQRLLGGERIQLQVEIVSEKNDAPEAIELAVLHSDAACLVIDKPAGLTVHPGAGQASGTLVNALLHHDPELAALPRAGLVHRLDKDTTGALLVARTAQAHERLSAALQERTIEREYLALVRGEVIAGDTVSAPLGRHPRDRLRQAVVEDGRPAVSHYRVHERLPGHTVLAVALETGRTHQIRVHLAHAGFPVVGDPLYGGGLRLPRGASQALQTALRDFRRQALHACRLAFVSPDGEQPVAALAPLPADMAALIEAIRAG
ncbi:MAG: 23S rRNA pseudouridine(1911/1915/1917) synthase RluD [Xanthomonadales bacterium]|nr:23S rRNA pseudouridine(1911/1915/1917) synthase RluD [Xanthomonadales bacterium]